MQLEHEATFAPVEARNWPGAHAVQADAAEAAWYMPKAHKLHEGPDDFADERNEPGSHEVQPVEPVDFWK